METLQLVLLALLQGITEFLPISSSAHLVILPLLFDWADQGLAFDVAVHVGSLVAVASYFRRELLQIGTGLLRPTLDREANERGRLGWMLIVATLPAIVVGFFAHDIVAELFRSPLLIAATSIGFGLLLAIADRFASRVNNIYRLDWRMAIIIGLAQALALVPGTSRSGITMTAGRMLGIDRPTAARFSFLLAIPVIAGAGSLETLKLISAGAAIDWTGLLTAVIVSAMTAYACIALFLKWIARIGMLPFVIYRVAFGLLLIYVFV